MTTEAEHKKILEGYNKAVAEQAINAKSHFFTCALTDKDALNLFVKILEMYIKYRTYQFAINITKNEMYFMCFNTNNYLKTFISASLFSEYNYKNDMAVIVDGNQLSDIVSKLSTKGAEKFIMECNTDSFKIKLVEKGRTKEYQIGVMDNKLETETSDVEENVKSILAHKKNKIVISSDLAYSAVGDMAFSDDTSDIELQVCFDKEKKLPVFSIGNNNLIKKSSAVIDGNSFKAELLSEAKCSAMFSHGILLEQLRHLKSLFTEVSIELDMNYPLVIQAQAKGIRHIYFIAPRVQKE